LGVSNHRRRIVFGLTAVLVGAIAFTVASSYIVFRGFSPWLAAAVGVLAFPIGPLAWHLVGERSHARKLAAASIVAKAPPKTTLTAGDRYWLRFVGVALVVLGPMIAVGRFDVARAAWRHGLWWWPTSYEPTTTHGGPLSAIGSGIPRTIDVIGTPLARVPSDAELVLYVQTPDEGRAAMAYGDKQVMLAAEGKGVDVGGDLAAKIAELNKQRSKIPWLPMDEIQLVSHSGTSVVAASAGWRSRIEPGTGPSAELLRELGRAPKDAYFIAAFIPRTTRDVLSTKAGAAWLSKDGEKLVIEGRIEANDEGAAKQLVADASSALDKAVRDAPKSCREQVGTIVKAIHLDQSGALVTGRLEIDGGALMGVVFCAMKDRS
jgi:hypothetical protein